MVEAADPYPIHSKHKAITALFLHVTQQKEVEQHKMLDVVLRSMRASRKWEFMWHHIKPPVIALLNKESPISVKQAIVLVSPHFPWCHFRNNKPLVQLWVAAATAVPSTDEVCKSVVDTLLQITSDGSLRPHVPTGMWSWLRKHPYLPPLCAGRSLGSVPDVVQAVRELGDIETLTSYLLLIWSEWDCLFSDGLDEMDASIQEDFSGIGMGYHRRELFQHLDYVLGQLDLGSGHLQQHKPSLGERNIQYMKDQYGQLKKVLLEVDREAIDNLIGGLSH
jgi:hypothetical protein